jgi:hypothetical protein
MHELTRYILRQNLGTTPEPAAERRRMSGTLSPC